MERNARFPIIAACGHAAKLVLFEIASPSKETRNKRIFQNYFFKYECQGRFLYGGREHKISLRLVNENEPQNNNELRILENPKLTRKIFKVRRENLLEINPQAVQDKEKIFLISCIVLAHAIHGKGFFPSPGRDKKKNKLRRRFIDYC